MASQRPPSTSFTPADRDYRHPCLAPYIHGVSDHVLARRLQWAAISWNAVEVFASLVVLWHMGDADDDPQTSRDQMARRLVALAFGLLAASLLVASAHTLWIGTEPDSSPLAIGYLSVTVVVMFTLARLKERIGARLESEPFRAEASMTFLDGCLAAGILIALVLNTTLGWWWADPLAAAVVGLVAASEAREGFASDRAARPGSGGESGHRLDV